MYTLILFAGIIIGVLIAALGIKSKKKVLTALGAVLAAGTPLFFWFMNFWGDFLWFENLGFGERFWTVIISQILLGAAGLAVGAVFIFLFSLLIKGIPSLFRWIALGLGGIFGMLTAATSWDVILQFLNRTSVGVTEPVLGKDAGFYLFTLPFLEFLYGFFFGLVILVLILTGLSASRNVGELIQNVRSNLTGRNEEVRDITPGGAREGTSKLLIYAGSLLLLLMALGKLLDRFRILYEESGVVFGPGWTDVNIKMTAYLIAAAAALVAAIFLLSPPLRRKLEKLIPASLSSQITAGLRPLIAAVVPVLLIWFLILTAIPALFQNLRVAPNEITMERPYIENNIRMTRSAFGLDDVKKEQFSVSDTFDEETVEGNSSIIDNIRLWDWRALGEVYKQFQEFRLYYEFNSINIDRYTIDGEYRSVMLSPRELNTGNLPPESQTFVNRHYIYTHGYGITMNTVKDFSLSGLPEFIVRDLPPQTDSPSLEVSRPEIYYGETTDDYVIVNSEEMEFDYPSGDENRYVRYQGTGGVEISNFFRKFLYGSKIGGTDFLFSGYMTDESRIMFRRQITERVREAAPFLRLDSEPYITLVDGKLHWIMDAYTSSAYFPYSQRYSDTNLVSSKWDLNAARGGYAPEGSVFNYLRNSVKVVIDPYNGDLDFYIYDEDDALIDVWSKIFPDLFKSKEEMPEGIRKHVRYPADYLRIQGEVYSKYHMTDPGVFYNQEDLWVPATEVYHGESQEVEPYYIMWERPGSDEPEFVSMMPFTPKNRQVMIGWIAGLSDPENYGEFISYSFPKDERVLGPQQMETKIDQDGELSSQLSLWDQRGSSIIRGNILVIPIDDTVLYVEPIYLQSDSAAYPELRIVALMHGDKLSYAPTFEEALEGLYKEDVPRKQLPSDAVEQEGEEAAAAGELPREDPGEADATAETAAGTAEEGAPLPQELNRLIGEANDAFENYFQMLGERQYNRASEELDRLERLLQQMEEQGSAQ
ncbi:MAG: UPF0182 family protein [Spirochaetaceae bacterium]